MDIYSYRGLGEEKSLCASVVWDGSLVEVRRDMEF